MIQATTPDQLADLVIAMYDVASHARRFQAQDPVDSARVTLLYQVRLIGPARPSDVATIARLDLSTVSRHLKELEVAGLIKRTEDPHDRRAAHVVITEEGQRVLNTVVSNRVDALRDVLMRWPADDRNNLGTLLRRLADDLAAEYCSRPPTSTHSASDLSAAAIEETA